MNPIVHILKAFPAILLDGAFSTELERRGCNLNDTLWSAKVLMENPDMIRQVHADYFAAGADCAITASYQASVDGFMSRGLSESDALALIRLSVTLAAEARDAFWAVPANHENRPRPLVAGSVGPYGAYLADGSEYRGDYRLTKEELIAFHRPRLRELVAAGADILACETLPCLLEAQALVELLREFPGVYAWFSFSARDGRHISSGEPVADCAAWLHEHEQAAAVGVNCTPPQHIASLIREIRSRTDKPVLVYPNSGEEYDAADKTWHGSACADSFAASAKTWYEEGARLLGGCCRTTPEDIRSIAAWARQLSR